MSYRVLFSDVGNVIAPFDMKMFTRNLSCSIGLSAEQVVARLYQETNVLAVNSNDCQGIHRAILTGAIKADDCMVEMRRLLGCSLDPLLFRQIFCDVFTPNPRLVSLWNSLRAQGKIERIILLSDADPLRLERALELTGFKPDGKVVSYEVGQLKPHDEMFRHALSAAAVSPQECIFVDDLDANVKAARKFGIESFRYMYPQLSLDAATELLMNEFRHIGLWD